MTEIEKLNESIHKARLKLRENWAEMLKLVNEVNLKLDKYLEEMMIK